MAAVKKHNATFFCQLWHVGRQSHNGEGQPTASCSYLVASVVHLAWSSIDTALRQRYTWAEDVEKVALGLCRYLASLLCPSEALKCKRVAGKLGSGWAS